MTKEEFWEKWIVQAYGGHVPTRLLLKKEYFLNDLDLLIETCIPPITLSSQSVVPWTYVPTVDPDMEGLGHQWVFPPADVFETAYCVCANCGVSSEEMESEELCTNPTGGEND